jgi:hypothetical protein
VPRKWKRRWIRRKAQEEEWPGYVEWNVVTKGSDLGSKNTQSRNEVLGGGRWSRTEPTIIEATIWPTVPATDDNGWWWVWSSRWNVWQGKPKYSEKTCPIAALSTTYPTWPDPGSNPGRCYGKPATNRPSYGTALFGAYSEVSILVEVRRSCYCPCSPVFVLFLLFDFEVQLQKLMLALDFSRRVASVLKQLVKCLKYDMCYLISTSNILTPVWKIK